MDVGRSLSSRLSSMSKTAAWSVAFLFSLGCSAHRADGPRAEVPPRPGDWRGAGRAALPPGGDLFGTFARVAGQVPCARVEIAPGRELPIPCSELRDIGK